ncbi:T9SS type A sorting domain-containing protein [Ekhidna sp. MALMAid0563]|uniref:T9SS type A sorting domain-containing protein n=1 Tax=Ekhidna sp. MALMAid0563 TaxID=3143937 RepID=UPI0032DF9A65
MQKIILAVFIVFVFNIKGSSQSATSVITCTPYTWSVTGETYSVSAQVIAGNDTLNFTMRENQVEVRRIFTCDSYYWSETDQTYTESGTYISNEITENGCTIEHILELTVNNTYNSSVGAADCDTYEWQELNLPVGSWEATAVDLDGSGTILATGNGTQGDYGEVKIFQWTETGWSQMGATLEGVTNNFGGSVKLSANGKYLSVGSPTVAGPGRVDTYEWNGANWVARGTPIIGIHEFEEFGFDIDFSDDGNIMAVSAPSSGRVAIELGEVRVYQWVGDDWEQMGNHIYKYEFSNSANNNGHSIALSGDGLTLLFGAPYSKGIFYNVPGKLFKYEWNGAEWEIVSNINGSGDQARYGWSVALSNTGDRLAVGSPNYNTNTGRVGWIGGTLNGETTGIQFGKSVALDYNGSIVAVGSPQYADTNASSGRVQLFRVSGDSYIQYGSDLFGAEESEKFGDVVALNHSGNILAVGSYKGFNTSGNPVSDMHVYYYGCTNTSQNCVPSTCTQLIEHTANISECNLYKFDGTYLTESGSYQAMFESPLGCDSLVTLNLAILSDRVDANISACGSYEFNGSTYTESTTTSGIFTNTHGCDSTVTLYLTIGTEESFDHVISACNSYEFNGSTLTTSGFYEASYTRESGCDSLARLDLTILESEEVSIEKQVCNSYEFDGTVYTNSGEYTATFTNTQGCDSLVTLNLEVVDLFEETIDITACLSYEFDGTTLTSSGTYNASYMSVEGCDSLVTLNLEIVDQFEETVNISVCESYEFDGVDLTESGTYSATFISTSGCDSLVSLNLTIQEYPGVSQIVEACGLYEFGNDVLISSGNYFHTFTNVNGCDSTVNLSLTILDESICNPLNINHTTSLTIFPNPVSKYAEIRGLSNDTRFELYDLLGKKVQDGTTNKGKFLLEVNEGTYLVVFPDLKQKIKLLKVD